MSSMAIYGVLLWVTIVSAAHLGKRGTGDLNCDFEGNLCSWKNLNYDHYDWQSTPASFGSYSYGMPESDPSKGKNGHYLLVNLGNQGQPRMFATLKSADMSATPSGGFCMTFSYFMGKFTKGSLRVYVEKSGTKELLWQRDASQGDGWHTGRIHVKSNAGFNIQIEAARGDYNLEGSIAIDDISTANGKCAGVPQTCGRTKFQRSVQSNLHKRIMQGTASRQGQWPWIVHIRTFTNDQGAYMQCGGSLIDREWVLTAAHCVEAEVAPGQHVRITDGSKVELHFGEHTQNMWDESQFVQTAKQVIIHPDRRSFGVAPHDITLIRLKHPLTLNEDVNLVCLPEGGEIPVGSSCQAAGWGKTFHNQGTSESLLHVNLEVISNDDCKWYYGASVTDEHICGWNMGRSMMSTCQGDSGGPLVWKDDQGAYELAGVVSFGNPCGTSNTPYALPSVFMRVTSYLPWIDQTMKAYQD